MPSVSLTAPTDYATQQADIERRRKYAELLTQQSMQPEQQQTAGGMTVPVSWTQHAAKLMQGYLGGQGQKTATEQQMALANTIRGNRQTDMQKYLDMSQGTPERWQGDASVPGDSVQTPATPGDPRAATAFLAASQDPLLSQLGMTAMTKGMEPYTLGEGAQRFGPGNVPIASNPKQHPLHFSNEGNVTQPRNPMTGAPVGAAIPIGMTPSQQEAHDENQGWGEPYELAGAMVRRNSITGKVEQVVARPPVTNVHNPSPVTAVTIQDPDNPNGTIIIDGRTKTVLGKGPKLTQTGTAEQKLSLGLPQANLRVQSMTQNLDRLESAIQALHDDPGLSHITGTLAGRTPNLTNKATGAQAQLDSIKAQTFVDALQAMREASKTGGAVGNVSDREGDKLQNTLAALGQAQGTADFQKQLRGAVEQIRRSKSLIQNAFDEQYGGVQPTQPENGSPPQRRATDKVRKYNPATGRIE